MMNENSIGYPRSFNPGDSGIPDEGIIVGRGGGFTWVYDDLVILPSGIVRFMTYMTDEPTIPQDFESVRLLIEPPEMFQQFVAELEAVDFYSIDVPPPASSAFEYIVLIQKEKGSHTVIWALDDAGDVPEKLLSVVRSIRQRIAEAFTKTHGS